MRSTQVRSCVAHRNVVVASPSHLTSRTIRYTCWKRGARPLLNFSKSAVCQMRKSLAPTSVWAILLLALIGKAIGDTFFVRHDHFDIRGNQIGLLKTNDWGALADRCRALPTCKGFTTNGALVSSIDLEVRVQAPGVSIFVQTPTSELSNHPAKFTSQLAVDEYISMVTHMKIFIYNIPENNAFPSLNCEYKYGHECIFPELLRNTTFVTTNPETAQFFFVPLPCTSYRMSVTDRWEGQAVANKTADQILRRIRASYPYFNRSLGADHFYVCAHDLGASLLEASDPVFRKNMIAIVNTADYNDPFYVPHKDIAMPPHIGSSCPTCTFKSQRPSPEMFPESRPKLAFFAGILQHGDVRGQFYEKYVHDQDFVLINGDTPPQQYQDHLAPAIFCLCFRGFRVWSPRISESLWYGCIPVIVSDYYDLPLQGLVEWSEFSVIIAEQDLMKLKMVLTAIRDDHSRLAALQARVWSVRHHFVWQQPSRDFDAFHCVLAKLWQRRDTMRFPALSDNRQSVE